MDNKLVFEKLFSRSLNDDGNKKLLEQITNDHPYFSPAHFFLLQQTDPGSPEYKKQAGINSVFFNDPHWLNFQLQQTSLPAEITETAFVETKIQEPLPDNADNNDDEVIMGTETPPMKPESIAEPQTGVKEEMLFEPMHMVDYFASQGIKLNEETQSADKLGKQLKSFTEWLKTMKKIHVDAVEDAGKPAEQTDAVIQSIAEKSNNEDEILTESMAEVFAKQGKVARAADVYQKLSLLNPSKSAYFAAKIEQLKGI